MSKAASAVALVATVAAVAAMFVPGVAGANGNGAVVERDPYGSPHSCFVIDTNGHSWTFECTIHRVTTPGGQVNEFLQGTVTGGSALPDKAVRDFTTAETGLLCDIFGTTSTDITQGVVTPGGQVKLTCRG